MGWLLTELLLTMQGVCFCWKCQNLTSHNVLGVSGVKKSLYGKATAENRPSFQALLQLRDVT